MNNRSRAILKSKKKYKQNYLDGFNFNTTFKNYGEKLPRKKKKERVKEIERLKVKYLIPKVYDVNIFYPYTSIVDYLEEVGRR